MQRASPLRILPRSITGQLTLAVLVVLVGAQIVAIALIVGLRGMQIRFEQDRRVVERVVSDMRALPAQLPADLPVSLREQSGRGVSFLSANDRAAIEIETERQPRLEDRLRRRLLAEDLISDTQAVEVIRHPRRRTTPEERALIESRTSGPIFRPRLPPDRTGPSGPGMREVIASVELAPGVWYNLMSPYYPAHAITLRAAGSTAIAALMGLILIGFLSYRITRPLRALAASADRLGRGESPDPIREDGPLEVRMAAAAFNRMQERIERLLDTQIAMLRGVSHDLRMPIARLRMRAEEIEDPAERARLIAGLDEMTGMVGSIMQASRDVASDEPLTDTDLGALVEAVAADAEEVGGEVAFTPPATRIALRCRRMALRRALANLVTNAVNYGGAVRIALSQRGQEIWIDVEDDGPGIPPERMEEATEPFVRFVGEDGPEGAGLGLAIARSAAESHGGRLVLRNRPQGGLRASIVLPV